MIGGIQASKTDKENIAYNNERISDIKHADGITDADIEAMAAEIPLDDTPADEPEPGDKPEA